MVLDPTTLIVTNILIMMLVSASYGLAWLESRQQPALLWMIAAALVSAIGLLCRITLPVLPAIVVSNGLVGAGALCVWMACRRLVGRRVWFWILGVPALVWLGLVCIPGFLNNANLRLVAANLIAVLSFGLGAREILRLDADRRLLKGCVAGLLIIQAAEDLAWLVFNLVTPTVHGTDFTEIPGFTFIDITTLVFSLLIAFGMIGLIREGSEQQYRRAALADALTGLGNRRQLDESLILILADARRRGQPLSLIMLDTDCFKSYNDLYGHLKGDACLRAIAQALQGALPQPDDHVYRYGGEEFVVLLPGRPLEAAMAAAERLRLAVRDMRLLHGGGPAGVVTISLGVATIAPDELRAEPADAVALLAAADRALYQAKRQGRDRVVGNGVSEGPPAGPGVARPRHRATRV